MNLDRSRPSHPLATAVAACTLLLLGGCASYDVIVRHGTVYDGSGGAPVLAAGEHTGATPGRVVRGPGWTG
jgi:hypothetical protein